MPMSQSSEMPRRAGGSPSLAPLAASAAGIVLGLVVAILGAGMPAAGAVGAGLAAVGTLSVVRCLRTRRDVALRAAGPAPERAQDIDDLLLRSDSVAQSLQDLVAHGQGQGSWGPLPELLRRVGLMEWQQAPRIRANHLSRNGRWWLYADEELSRADYDRMVALEGALNVYADLVDLGISSHADSQETDAGLASVFSHVAVLSPRTHTGDARGEFLKGPSASHGEWACRLGFASLVENLPAPFRIPFSMQANAAEGHLCADAEIPPVLCFALVAPDDRDGQVRAANAYALRLCVALGRHALSPLCGSLRRATINCLGQDGRVVLSADVTAESLPRLTHLAGAQLGRAQSLPEDAALRFCQAPDGTLKAVEPFATPADHELNPPARFSEVELDHHVASGELSLRCGARTISDLGINEKAGRVSAWNEIAGELGDTTQRAVSRLVELRGATDDVTVAEACDRASKALVDGTMDVANRRELARLFVDGTALGAATTKAWGIFDEESPSRSQLESALGTLESALSPITEMGVYLDDQDSVFRYFNSVAERVSYNRMTQGEKRAVRLVPDEYYRAHSMAARILTMLERVDEAGTHADELMRLAPVTPDAALSKVRCLEERSQIFEAARVLKDAISYASTARDMAICFYRLAFMEWRLGRGDLAVACYQRSMALHPEMAEQASEELSDLLEEDRDLHRLDPSDVVPTLEKANIPAGNVAELRLRTRDAAVACADAGIFSVARPLTCVLLEFGRDDALVDVYHSMGRMT